MGIEPTSEAWEATKKELGAATARQTTFLALDPSTPSSGMLPHGDLRTKLDLSAKPNIARVLRIVLIAIWIWLATYLQEQQGFSRCSSRLR